ncbi:MAG: flavodoxin [Clostridiales bacterium]|nr:flavodoxin [Clostridiales bacterium]
MEKSKVAVHYFSKSGNTKKLADEIAKTVDCKAEQIPSPIEDKVDILFLGASVYWGGISSEVKDYIQTLNKDSIGKVVVFSTSALAERAFPQIQKKLQDKGIPIESNNFYCRGEFTALHKGRPNQEDLNAARKFAAEMIAELH